MNEKVENKKRIIVYAIEAMIIIVLIIYFWLTASNSDNQNENLIDYLHELVTLLEKVFSIFNFWGITVISIISFVFKIVTKENIGKKVLVRKVTKTYIKGVMPIYMYEIIEMLGYLNFYLIIYMGIIIGNNICEPKIFKSVFFLYIWEIIVGFLLLLVYIYISDKIEKMQKTKIIIMFILTGISPLLTYSILINVRLHLNNAKCFKLILAIYVVSVIAIYFNKIKIMLFKCEKYLIWWLRSIRFTLLVIQTFYFFLWNSIKWMDYIIFVYAILILVETSVIIWKDESELENIQLVLENGTIKNSKGNINQYFGKIEYKLFDGTKEVINCDKVKKIEYSYHIPNLALKFYKKTYEIKVIMQSGKEEVYDKYRMPVYKSEVY